MKGVNKVILVGYLGRDPEPVDGKNITKISVATTEKWKDKDSGEMQERTEWHRVTAFGHAANSMAKYLYKGAMVYIEGSNRTSKYQKDGQDHYSTEVIVQKYNLLSGIKDSDSGDQQNPSSTEQNKSAPQQDDGFDDDIPFN